MLNLGNGISSHTISFEQLNPQHAVPTLVDGDFVLTESRAVAVYVAEVYGKGTTLLPESAKERARLDMI